MNTDEHRWRRSKVVTVFKVISTIVAVGLVVSCKRSTSYQSFLKRDQNYYAQIALACSNLLSQLPPSSTNEYKELKIAGSDPSLPPILRDLHATHIRSISGFMDGSNSYSGGVAIDFGVTRTGWAIVWERNDYGRGNTPWELYVNSEGGPKIVYSTKEPALQPRSPTKVTN